MHADALGAQLTAPVEALLKRFDLGHSLLDVMLAFLLFAGALHVKLSDLIEGKWLITLLATVGVALTTAMIGLSMWQIAPWFGISIDLIP